MACVPVIDFQEYGQLVEDTSKVSIEALKSLGKRLVDAFKTYGFCYLKNHGMDETLIKEYMQVSREFFMQSPELKAKYTLGSDHRFGWVKLEGEKLNKERPPAGDLHEAFDYTPCSDHSWPPVEKFEALAKTVFKSGSELANRFLDVLSLGVDLPLEFLRDAHHLMGKTGNCSAVRTLYYPPLPSDDDIKPGQVRLGEHSDFGTASFTFQDNVGGLEMKTPTGEFIPAPAIEGTISVHTCILLQRWTSDALPSTVHRILIPEDEIRKKKERQSIVFFIQPDDECLIKCIDGSDKYKPITYIDCLREMYDEIIY